MKKSNLIFFLIMTICAVNYAREYTALPLHPLSPYQNYHFDIQAPIIRILADSVSYQEQSYISDMKSGGYAIYKRSSDELTDTLYLYAGLTGKWIYEYSPEGQLLWMKDGFSPLLTGTTFVYDPQRRLIADTTYLNNQPTATTSYAYRPDTVLIHHVDINNPINTLKKHMSYQYTDSSYIEKTVRI